MTKYSNNLIDNFPDYLFNKINQQKLALRQSGEDVIDLGYGNPDIPSHELVVEKLIESAQIKKNHIDIKPILIFSLAKELKLKIIKNISNE